MKVYKLYRRLGLDDERLVSIHLSKDGALKEAKDEGFFKPATQDLFDETLVWSDGRIDPYEVKD